MSRTLKFVLSCTVILAAALFLAPIAGASIAPSVTLTQSGTAAGSSQTVGLDFKFTPSGSDSPKDMTVELPAGLLANASIDGGACLTTKMETAACQIGTGVVTASPIVLGMPVGSMAVNVTFYLVPPPSAGDLAGVQTVANSGQLVTGDLGTPAAVDVRPATDPAGVGLNEVFTNLPDSASGLTISVSEINGSFTGLRLPDTCPSTPANVIVTADSYSDPTQQTATAPLNVTACSALPYAPKFTVTAARDSGDVGTQVVTDITQQADEASSRSTALAFPASVLAPNAAAVVSGGILCTDPTFASCQPIGSASSTSPLYPKSLSGETYLTGSLTAPAITIRFPAPFALTLSGAVDLATNTTTFTGLPDIPLTDLKVTLSGGPNAAFAASCNPASGTATSTLTTQNGDRTVSVPAAFTVSGCPAPTGTPPGSGQPPGTGKPPSTGPGQNGNGKGAVPTLSGGSLSGLAHRRPLFTFTARAGSGAPKLHTLQLKLPSGLRIIVHRVHRHQRVLGVSATGGRISSLKLSHGRLLITLRSSSARVTIKLSSRALAESSGLAGRQRHHKLHSLSFGVVLRDAQGKTTSLALRVTRLRG